MNENENFFECPKCGSEFENNDHEYQYCITCTRGYCRNCSSICESCEEKKCFRCVSYLECCNKNVCQDCGTCSYCSACQDYHCSDCLKMYTCENCEENTCQISTDHFLNTYCLSCSREKCIMCDEQSFETYCQECLLDIENVLEIKNTPFGVVDNIINYLEPGFREYLNEYLEDDIENYL